MAKRNVFDELMQGFEDLKQEREGKLTLRNQEVEKLPPVTITPGEIVAIREKLHMSRAVFALKLRLGVRTLESWEQGRSQPNSTSAVLLKLVGQDPSMLDKVADL